MIPMRRIFGGVCLACLAWTSGCDGATIDLGHDLDAGPDALLETDPRFVCAAGATTRAPLSSMADVDRTLQRKWIPCSASTSLGSDRGIEFVDDGTEFAL